LFIIAVQITVPSLSLYFLKEKDKDNAKTLVIISIVLSCAGIISPFFQKEEEINIPFSKNKKKGFDIPIFPIITLVLSILTLVELNNSEVNYEKASNLMMAVAIINGIMALFMIIMAVSALYVGTQVLKSDDMDYLRF
jgi:hypothetical protein